jgi:crossover junction endodeoxyribonuclease RusA
MTALSITVYGLPGPQGSKRAVIHKGTGRAVLFEHSHERVRNWREAVKSAVIDQMGESGVLTGPLAAVMIFTLPKPKSAPKTRQTWPDRKPDLSKLVRATEDALTDAAAWEDDARVVECKAAKRYPGEGAGALVRPGCLIVIRQVSA